MPSETYGDNQGDAERRNPNEATSTDRPSVRRRRGIAPAEDEVVEPRDEELRGPSTIRRISWGAVFAGAVIIAATQVVLNLLGISIGFGAIDPVVEADPFSGLGVGTGIWLLVCTVIAFFLGGLVASRLAGLPRRKDGILHGIIAWGLVSLVTLYFMTTAVGSILNTATGAVGQTLQLAGRGVAAAVPEATGEVVQAEGLSLEALVTDLIDQLQQSVTGPPGTDAGDEAALRQALNAFFTPGNDISDRQALIDLLSARTGLTQAEAEQLVERYDEEYQSLQTQLQDFGQQVQEEVAQIGGSIAEALSSAAFWAFIASIIGVVSAAIGGAVGIPKDLPASAAVRRE